MDTNGHELNPGVAIPNVGECYDAEIMTREELARTVERIRKPEIGDALAKDGTIWAVVGLSRHGVSVIAGTSYHTMGNWWMPMSSFGDSATLTFVQGAGFFPALGSCRP